MIKKSSGQAGNDHLSTLEQLCSYSTYACRQKDIVNRIIQDDNLNAAIDYDQDISSIELSQSMQRFAKVLRNYRHYHLLRLWLKEQTGNSDTVETMQYWSACADAILLHALAFCKNELQIRYGLPMTTQNRLCEIDIVALGKLGGQELNFSSDVDIMFVYSQNGQTSGPSVIDTQQYFTILIQRFIKLLQDNTPEGFVFRVDLRLRPFGASGPLASSQAALETYYQEQGRNWERYAMLKARVVGKRAPEWFSKLIIPFAYRRYVDYSVIESLRSIKSMIERELAQNPRLNDIKRGQGGIREIEFIVQSLQLIRGGRIPSLRQQNCIEAIELLKTNKLLDKANALKKAYLFYRKIENVLQIQNDEQRHHFPSDKVLVKQMSGIMGFSSSQAFFNQLMQYQRIVNRVFIKIFRGSEQFLDENRLIFAQMTDIWLGHVEEKMAVTWLLSIGFANAPECYKLIQEFRQSARVQRLSQAAQMYLDNFMPRLLFKLQSKKEAHSILLPLLNLLDKIVGRSAYLVLLSENNLVLDEVIFWFEKNIYIATLLTQYPFLLEVFVDVSPSWKPWSKATINKKLDQALEGNINEEQAFEILRQFKLKCMLMIARSELKNQVLAWRVSAFLSALAQVLVNKLCALVMQQLSARYPTIYQYRDKFAILAYGKAGSYEMNYDSDLDLVFLHTLPSDLEPALNRFIQKFIHVTTVRTQSGILYRVDTRLRPSGSAGLLISPMDAFKHYQLQKAWTWEHQALLKAKVFYGTVYFKKALLQLKKQVLAQTNGKIELCNAVIEMRKKVGYSDAANDFKRIPGGLLDLEFFIQFLVLYTADTLIVRYTNTLDMMKYLTSTAVLTLSEFERISCAYQHLHAQIHYQFLGAEVCDINKEAKALNKQIERISKRIMQDKERFN